VSGVKPFIMIQRKELTFPKCKCGGLIRPDVVWFGEYLPEDQFKGAEIAASDCDLFFVVGTSAVVISCSIINLYN